MTRGGDFRAECPAGRHWRTRADPLAEGARRGSAPPVEAAGGSSLSLLPPGPLRCQAVIRQRPLVLQQTAMATGITVTSNPDPAQLESLGVTSWPTWSCAQNFYLG